MNFAQMLASGPTTDSRDWQPGLSAMKRYHRGQRSRSVETYTAALLHFGKPTSAQDIAAHLGVSDRAAGNILRKLEAAHLVVGQSKRPILWSLKQK